VNTTAKPSIFERQWIHAVVLVLMLVGAWLIARGCSCFHRGDFWGIGTWTWFWIAVEIPIAHQIYVWFCWRTELHHGLITRMFGGAGFAIYAAGFTVLFVGRLVAVIALAISSHDTLPLAPALLKLLKPLAVVLLIPTIYLAYSVARYFGILRAFGADHFDEAYRLKPFVRQGIFRFSSNAMYVFGFLALWIPGLWLASRPAIVAALFSHLYIWVHYYTTEKPDMRRIYGAS
jgi:hypothetical protein